jgi:hypothetical protein
MRLWFIHIVYACFSVACHPLGYIGGAFVGVTNEQFNSFNMHGINNVKNGISIVADSLVLVSLVMIPKLRYLWKCFRLKKY